MDRVEKDIERRTFSSLELRDVDDGPPTIIGYAAVFNKLSQSLGGFQEKIEPGAFADSLKSGDVRALWNHDANLVLGRTVSGTLRLHEDPHGLAVEIKPPVWAAPQLETLRRGDVDQMSFGFRTIEDSWETIDGKNIRTLKKVDVFDVSIATFGAYPQTEVAVRSLKTWQESQKTGVPIEILRRKLDMAEVDEPLGID